MDLFGVLDVEFVCLVYFCYYFGDVVEEGFGSGGIVGYVGDGFGEEVLVEGE